MAEKASKTITYFGFYTYSCMRFYPAYSFNEDENIFEQVRLPYVIIEPENHDALQKSEKSSAAEVLCCVVTEEEIEHHSKGSKAEIQTIEPVKVTNATESNIYKIYELKNVGGIDTAREYLNTENGISVSGEKLYEGDMIMLKMTYDSTFGLFGPFRVCKNTDTNTFYVNPNAKGNKYLVTRYSADPESGFLRVSFNRSMELFIDCCFTDDKTSIDTLTNEMYKDILSGKLAMEDVISGDEKTDNSRKEKIEELKKTSSFMHDLICNSEEYRELSKKYEELKEERDQYKEQSDYWSDFADRVIYTPDESLMFTDDDIYGDDYDEDDLDHEFGTEDRKEQEKNDPEALKAVISDLLSNNPDIISDLLDEELQDKCSKYDAKVIELQSKNNELDAINKKISDKRAELSDVEKETKKAVVAGIKAAVTDPLKSGRELETAKIAFEPALSSMLMRAAAEFESEEDDKTYENKYGQYAALDAFTPNKDGGGDVFEYVVKSMKKQRNYKDNDIINICICIAQNFITILSGDPGTGKTTLCDIIADVLDLDGYGKDLGRYVKVSVERGWMSKRDLIGYFNPLTRKYDKSNGRIYDALMTLDNETGEDKTSKYPFMILLDEANLSPVEHYWSEFMDIAGTFDNSKEIAGSINIGLDKELSVPGTLRFLATMNTDQTTEILSPRLIDRSMIIKLPSDFDINWAPTEFEHKRIAWKDFVSAFSKQDGKLGDAAEALLERIYELFDGADMNVSQRVKIAINKYVKTATKLMQGDTETRRAQIAVDYAVLQKLLPKISGYYKYLEGFFESMLVICSNNNLIKTKEALQKMIKNKEKNMGYCQYLI